RSSAALRSRSRHIAIGALVSAIALASPARAQSNEQQPSQPDQGAVPSGASGAIRVPAQPAPDANAPVTPPQIVHFENAPYPPEAQKLGLEANVVLRLAIDKDGKVTAVTVIEPAGHGFDEAAALAAKKFLFEPGRRGARPVPFTIDYQYRFTLT